MCDVCCCVIILTPPQHSSGNNVHEIYKRTACKIQVHQEGLPDTADRRVSFTGTPEQILEAKSLCNALLKDAGNGMVDIHSILHTQGHTTTSGHTHTHTHGHNPLMRIMETDIDPDKVRLVIGARGVTIGEVMKRSGCKVFVNQNFPPGESHKVRNIVGIGVSVWVYGYDYAYGYGYKCGYGMEYDHG